MGDAEGTPDDARPIRFPFVAAALCVTSLTAAVWLFFRYSYAWDVRPDDLTGDFDDPLGDVRNHPMLGRYVRLGGVFHEDRGAHRGRMAEAAGASPVVPVFLDRTEPLPAKVTEVILRGRVVLEWGESTTPDPTVSVDCTQGRWHGASVAGFVVAAWGVFIFAAALRHWLGLRRAHGAETGGERP